MLVIHRASPVDGPIDGEDQEQGGEGDDGLPQGEAGGEPDILPSRQEVDQDAQAPRAQKRPDGDQEGAERPRREHILPDDGGDEGNDGEGEGVEPLKRPPDQDVAEETHDQGENGPPAGPLVHGLHGRQDGVEERGQPPDADPSPSSTKDKSAASEFCIILLNFLPEWHGSDPLQAQKKIGDLCRFGENNGRFGLFCEKNFVVVNDFGYFRKYFERRFVKYGSYD